MEIGMVGLGRMGAAMSERLMKGGHKVVAYDPATEAVARCEKLGAVGAKSLEEVAQKLSAPRAVWLMVPAGETVTKVINELLPHLDKGDTLIDGGNSNYHETVRRGKELSEKGINYVDAGTSGGVWGLEKGYCLMVGGPDKAVKRIEPTFKTLAPEDGYAHVGPSGAGHFTKMIHNGIEYGMLQAYAEGFELLKASDFSLDLHQLAALWQHGSVIRSWLLELTEHALAKDPELANIRGYVEDSGEGRWTVFEAIDKNVPAPVLTLSLLARFASRQEESFSAKVIAALRKEFGGHAVKGSDK